MHGGGDSWATFDFRALNKPLRLPSGYVVAAAAKVLAKHLPIPFPRSSIAINNGVPEDLQAEADGAGRSRSGDKRSDSDANSRISTSACSAQNRMSLSTVHRRGDGEVLLGLLALARAPGELAEAEVAVGDEERMSRSERVPSLVDSVPRRCPRRAALVLLCYESSSRLRHATTGAAGQPLKQRAGQELVRRGDGRRHMTLRPHREPPAA